MLSSLLQQSTAVAFIIHATFLSITGASQVLSLRDETCSDGGVCLDIDGNVCCSGGNSGENGCMFSSGVCCGNGYWCYAGQFCSTTDPNANSNGAVNCCEDASCSTVASGGLFLIPYNDQPFYTSGAVGSTSAASTTASSAAASVASSVGSSSKTTEAASTPPKGSTTAPTSSPSSTASKTSASPTATKASSAVAKQVDVALALVIPVAMMILWGL